VQSSGSATFRGLLPSGGCYLPGMPELPEVETVCRQLREGLVGRRVLGVTVRRKSVVRMEKAATRINEALLEGAMVKAIHRHGKQMAIEAGNCQDQVNDSRVVAVHLGMSGQLRLTSGADEPKHAHVLWHLSSSSKKHKASNSTLMFVDPRRFGGLWAFDDLNGLQTERWSKLGPDAVDSALAQDWQPFWRRLKRSKRPIKAALLDQAVLAGVGNIYADEALFAAGIRPKRRTDRITSQQCRRLIGALQAILRSAIEAGGSTLKDYVHVSGASGDFQFQHQVYGRGGQSCPRCDETLRVTQVAQRTTVHCSGCQV